MRTGSTDRAPDHLRRGGRAGPVPLDGLPRLQEQEGRQVSLPTERRESGLPPLKLGFDIAF